MDFAKRGFLLFTFLLLLQALAGCVSTQNTKTASEPPALPGWVHVSYGLSASEVAERRGTLADTYDEYVGQLLDDGMSTENSAWLKPVYGNQNLLWVQNAEIGKARARDIQASSKEFEPMGYAFRQGVLLIDGVKWWYTGYQAPVSDVAYQDFTFYCEADAGVSVMFWGDGMAEPADETEAVRKLLRIMNRNC